MLSEEVRLLEKDVIVGERREGDAIRRDDFYIEAFIGLMSGGLWAVFGFVGDSTLVVTKFCPLSNRSGRLAEGWVVRSVPLMLCVCS